MSFFFFFSHGEREREEEDDGKPFCDQGLEGLTPQKKTKNNNNEFKSHDSYIVLVVQVLLAIVTEAVVIGVIFARISHPQQRARTIGISQVAVVARRDGILKFMFRVADLRATQVVEPQVKAYLYTWGAGRTTAEGASVGFVDFFLILLEREREREETEKTTHSFHFLLSLSLFSLSLSLSLFSLSLSLSSSLLLPSSLPFT